MATYGPVLSGRRLLNALVGVTQTQRCTALVLSGRASLGGLNRYARRDTFTLGR